MGVFARHKVAANLLMVMMVLAGLWGLTRLNTQFFPNFALDFVTVRVAWSGASAEDVETSVIDPLEEALRNVDNVRTMTSTSAEGVASITLEFHEGSDMGVALDQVKEQVALVRNLPADAEEPEIGRVLRHESVARVLITSTSADLQELRGLIRRMERELLDRGIAKITVTGLPEEEIAIQVPTRVLNELRMSLVDIAARVNELSRDLPAGTVGRDDVSRQLRALGQRRRELGFERLPLLSDDSGRLLRVGDVATVERRPRARQVRVLYEDRPAVELHLRRAENTDSLESAEVLRQWLRDVRPRLPAGVEIVVLDEFWRLIRERIMLLLKNGLGGLVLVIGVLFFFLNGRVAGWVALGIPVSFMAALAALYAFGGSINMISLFALIMALGIIVDDAIVVGEDALTHYQRGEHPLQASEGGARRMLAPVMSSSLTTVAAFMPLMLVSGIIGNILFTIPLVVVCVILASLMESFLVLPGHLRSSFRRLHHAAPSPTRARLDRGFARFRERLFRPLVAAAVRNPWTTLAAAVAVLLISVGLLAGGRIAFNFFPTPETTVVHANAAFVAGTPPERVEPFVKRVEEALYAAEETFDEELVRASVVHLGTVHGSEGRVAQAGDQFATVFVELVAPDRRETRNPALLEAWRERIVLPPGIESFSIFERRAGPPGRDVEVRFTGQDAAALKSAALELEEHLRTIPGVTSTEDDMPFGQQQLIYRLTPEGEALGLTVEDVGRQLRAAYDGHIAQIFQDGEEELEVRVMLPDHERHQLASLDNLPIVLAGGRTVPLSTVVDLETDRGFQILRHADGQLAVQVSADLDPGQANSNAVNAALAANVLPSLSRRYGIDFSFEGRAADQAETLSDMQRGAAFALAMIYLVLAWVFASYGWPLVVMCAIPFGLVGALAGHWLMGIELTILSLFGLFGLAGIVVNDAIILVTFYKGLRERGSATRDAIVEAACQRLRAVLLTSLTTIGGLTPLLFETSLQAQFLIPMAVSISFGLAFATLLVLVVIPALLCIHEQLAGRVDLAAPGRAVLTERTVGTVGPGDSTTHQASEEHEEQQKLLTSTMRK
ncbi:MAG: efflux RND transporter permease subunit [Gammaproteobacteria bacterium]|nr:efflux RND transporter permease subunit [Gammaproteobacteria bacterium]NIR83339.1 efflux RND transporter permease subunit [Gammaproteobacteria bacterium]NIR91139.1 efflux RND transporter permease subunit [Gammaproteobacteria bacterium]NIU04506.1 efflux RND transporter permease subunit [Gammaproteobacteria bacterium]NIW87142.1 MMPL family transporter [Gammaproteobacteria bacterium]